MKDSCLLLVLIFHGVSLMKVEIKVEPQAIGFSKPGECGLTVKFDSYSSIAKLKMVDDEGYVRCTGSDKKLIGIEKYLIALTENAMSISNKPEDSKLINISFDAKDPNDKDVDLTISKEQIDFRSITFNDILYVPFFLVPTRFESERRTVKAGVVLVPPPKDSEITKAYKLEAYRTDEGKHTWSLNSLSPEKDRDALFDKTWIMDGPIKAEVIFSIPTA